MKNSAKAILLVIILFPWQVYTQDNRNAAAKEEVQNYINEQIVPGLTIHQQQFMTMLSDYEKQRLDEIKAEIAAFQKKHKNRSEKSQQNRNGGNKGGKGNYKGEHQRNEKREAIHAEVELIANAYPESVAKYQSYIEEKSPVWKSDLEKIRDKYQSKQGKSKKEKAARGQKFFERMSDPVWLLLWDAEKPLMGRTGHHQRKQGSANSE
jgi:hypothetical protein